jgi:glycosyltransferase involved in cell wall biosynthesis
MKPRIFIAIHYMHLGGAEISLIGLLQALDPKKVDVDLFVYSHEGELMKQIPDYVNLLSEIPAYKMFERPMKEVLKKGHLSVLFARLKAKMRMRSYLRKKQTIDGRAIMGFLGEEMSKVVPDINPSVEYELAISFLTPHNFVRDHVRAKKKICWIHTDYTRIDVNTELELPVWDSFDYIASISSDVTKTFLQVFPSLKNKIIEIENILTPDFVRQRSILIDMANIYSEMKTDDNCIRLLTIGRFDPAKKLEEIPAICRGIIESGINVRWYIIGYGSGSGKYIRKEIEAEGMQDYVFLFGKKENPYPYIKACDWYIQPSRYEGKSVVVREAQILCKPVIVTNYPTAQSQIRHNVDGIIVPMDIQGCVKEMANTLRNESLKNSIVKCLEEHDYGNVSEVDKIYALIENNITI